MGRGLQAYEIKFKAIKARLMTRISGQAGPGYHSESSTSHPLAPSTMDGTVVPIVVQNIRAAYEALQYRVQRALQTQLGDQYRLGIHRRECISLLEDITSPSVSSKSSISCRMFLIDIPSIWALFQLMNKQPWNQGSTTCWIH